MNFRSIATLALTLAIGLAWWASLDTAKRIPFIGKNSIIVPDPSESRPRSDLHFNKENPAKSNETSTQATPSTISPQAPEGQDKQQLEVIRIRTEDLLDEVPQDVFEKSAFSRSYRPIQREFEFKTEELSDYKLEFDQDLPNVAAIVIVGGSGQTLISMPSINGAPLNQSGPTTLYPNDWIKSDAPPDRLRSFQISGRSKINKRSRVQVFLQILEDSQ